MAPALELRNISVLIAFLLKIANHSKGMQKGMSFFSNMAGLLQCKGNKIRKQQNEISTGWQSIIWQSNQDLFTLYLEIVPCLNLETPDRSYVKKYKRTKGIHTRFDD